MISGKETRSFGPQAELPFAPRLGLWNGWFYPMSRVQKLPTASFSPYYGCVIMIAAILVFGGIIGWSAYTYFVQDSAIAAITVDAPAPLPSAELPPETMAALQKRLTDFAAAATTDRPAELALTLAELNALLPLAPDTGSGNYAGKLRLIRSNPVTGTLTAQTSLPMNKKFWEKGFRYLVGEVTFHIYLHEEGPDAKVVDVQIPGKYVEPGLIQDMGRWPWLGLYQSGPLGAVLKGIRHVQVTAEGVLLSTQKK